jgi:hypothetical protein
MHTTEFQYVPKLPMVAQAALSASPAAQRTRSPALGTAASTVAALYYVFLLFLGCPRLPNYPLTLPEELRAPRQVHD